MSLTYQQLLLEKQREIQNQQLTEEQKTDPTTFGSLPTMVGGLAAEVAIGEGAKYGGAALGGFGGPLAPITVPMGYIVGGLGGGALGSITNQRLQGGDVSWGRVVADSLINLIPAGKATKGASFLARAAKSSARQGAVGLAMGAGGATLESVVDEDRLPTLEELEQGGISGAWVGAGFGLGGEVLGKVMGQSVREFEDNLRAGKVENLKAVNALQRVMGQKWEASDNDLLKFVFPRTTLGKNVSETIARAQRAVEGD
jgi:hypothetical protein